MKFVEKENQPEERSEESFSMFSLNLEHEFCSNKLISCYSICNNVSNSFRSRSDCFAVHVVVENVKLIFEIDTGSAVSAISEELYRLNFKNIMLKPFDLKLKAYNGAPIPVEGCFDTHLIYKKKSYSLKPDVIHS